MHDPEESIQMGEVEPLSFSDQTMNVELVQRLLRDREWTWAVLAARMGMNKSTVSRVVKGDCRPGARFIFRLQALFPGEPELFVPVERTAA